MHRDLAHGKLILDYPAEAVARLTIHNSPKRNALDHEILDAFAEVMGRLDHGIKIRCVIITGHGHAFSAGYDIGNIPEARFERDAEALVAHPFHEAMGAISDYPYPTVAALNGHCLGGGLELALRCDIRICAHGAKLGMPPAKLGLVYGHTGLAKFIEVIGAARTRELFLSGRTVEAERAEAIGLVHETAPAAGFEELILERAAEIAANAPLSMRGNKQAIDLLARGTELTEPEEQALIELRRACFGSEDMREGIRAFAEKRPARWLGR